MGRAARGAAPGAAAADRGARARSRNLLGAPACRPDVVKRIVAAAEGNPLYVEQMLSMLVDSGALRQEDGRGSRRNMATSRSRPPSRR